MRFEGPLEDRLAIRERYSAYNDGSTLRDMDAWLANWADDCVWYVLDFELRGKPALAQSCAMVWNAVNEITVFGELVSTVVRGDRATGRSYCRETLFLKAGGVRELFAEYTDELVRIDGVWLFASRRHRMIADTGEGTPLPVET
jgi:hypothetical protein